MYRLLALLFRGLGILPPYRYWVGLNGVGRMFVQRDRTNPAGFCTYNPNDIKTLLDGPFNTQEDAVNALEFWRHQYTTKVNA